MRRTVLVVLFVLLPFSHVLGQEQTAGASDYTSQGMTAYSQGDHPRAVDAFKKAFALRPENSSIAYNISCSYALQGEKDSALVWLEKALELGVYFFSDDEDLESLRPDPRYKALEDLGKAKIAELEAREWKPVMELPDGYATGTPCPAVIALHGFGSNPVDFSAVLAPPVTGKGYILCCPYGPEIRGSTAFGWGECAGAGKLILETVQYLTTNYQVDTTRIILLGYSQGGEMAFCAGLRNAGAFDGLITVAGYCCERVGSYLEAPGVGKMPVYMMIGEKDRSLESNRTAERLMKEKGVRAELVVYPGLGHAFPPDAHKEITKALDWMEQRGR